MKKTTITLSIISSVFAINLAHADSYTMQPAPTPYVMDGSVSNQSPSYGEPQMNPNMENRMALFDEKTKEDNPDPKTAAEQGFQSVDEIEKQRQEAADFFSRNTARQRGVVVNVPTEDVGVIKDKKMSMWLFNWKGRLMDKGISAEKIDFEASRLNKEDFEKWASRQLRFAENH